MRAYVAREDADAVDESLGVSPTLADYVRYALAHEPGLRAAYEHYVAASERIEMSRSYPDPRLTYRYYAEEVETRVGPQRQSLGIAQTVPWFGKLRARGDASEEEARAAWQRFEGRRSEVAAEVTRAYCELYYLGRALDIVRRRVELVRSIEEIARTRYAAGAASHPDVVRAQVELGRLEDQLRSLADREVPLVAALNAAIGRDVSTPTPLPEEVALEGGDLDRAALLQELEEASPQLLAAMHEERAARRAVDLAAYDGRPDFTLGLDWIDTGDARMGGVPDSGKDPWIVGLSLNLPLDRGKYGAQQAEARARLRASVQRRDALRNALAARLDAALYAMRDTRRKIGLYRDALIPKAQEALAATDTSYRAGQAGFSDWVDAERTLLEFELSLERALADHGRATADVESILGRSIHAGGQ